MSLGVSYKADGHFRIIGPELPSVIAEMTSQIRKQADCITSLI
jgi:hypothetical protein